MTRPDPTVQLIEFKGSTLPVVAVTLHSLQPEKLATAAAELFGDDPFFDGDAALLELAHLGELAKADWHRVKYVLKMHGLNVIGVRGGSDELRHSAAAAGLPTLALLERPARSTPSVTDPAPATTEDAAPALATPALPAEQPSAAQSTPAEAPPPSAASATTLFVDRPLRSGQQVYARGGDLVMLAAVNAGAEIIADGSIHIYAPLRGRALAGARGAEDARIFCTRFDAELVSIAGLYRTFDGGVPTELAGRPVQVCLSGKSTETADKLIVVALKTD